MEVRSKRSKYKLFESRWMMDQVEKTYNVVQHLFLNWGSRASSFPLHERAFMAGIELKILKNASSPANLLLVKSIFCKLLQSVKCSIEVGVWRSFLERLIVCSEGQQDKLSMCDMRLFDKSKMVKSFSVSKPCILLIRFLLMYRHLNCCRHFRFSMIEKPVLSSHNALQAV